MDYSEKIVGRQEEQKTLQKCFESPKAEFVAIYGRRRIGKTFLVKQFFKEEFDFYTTGVYQVSKAEQLRNWKKQLQKFSGQSTNIPKNWFEAFDQLENYLRTLKKKGLSYLLTNCRGLIRRNPISSGPWKCFGTAGEPIAKG